MSPRETGYHGASCDDRSPSSSRRGSISSRIAVLYGIVATTTAAHVAPRGMFTAMIRRIAPQFFTTNLPATLAYYRDTLGFECIGTWHDPPVYAIVARDQHRIHFRLADPPTPNPDKYADELLDAYLLIENADALYAEYSARGVEFTRALGDTPWHSREFVVKDCDGRLLAFGANSE